MGFERYQEREKAYIEDSTSQLRPYSSIVQPLEEDILPEKLTPQVDFDFMQLLRVPQAEQAIQGKGDETKTEEMGREDVTEKGAVIQEKSEEKPNLTGLPDDLKAGVENLSGYSLDDVRVHYNSPKLAQLQALAYTHGTEIHVASGQEEHLPHEAWHVVQQMQGSVKPTMQMKGVQINDDQGLEKEADVMGKRALMIPQNSKLSLRQNPKQPNGEAPVQGMFEEIYELAAQYSLLIGVALAVATIYGIAKTVNLIKNCIHKGRDVNKALTAVLKEDKSIESDKEAIEGSKDSSDELGEIDSDQGMVGDCLYTAVSLARGNPVGEIELALRQIATDWLINVQDDHEIFQYAARQDLINVVSKPQEWNDDAGDISAVVLAYSQQITLHVVTNTNVYVFNPGNIVVTIYYHSNHYTCQPVEGVHTGKEKEIISSPKKSVSKGKKADKIVVTYSEFTDIIKNKNLFIGKKFKNVIEELEKKYDFSDITEYSKRLQANWSKYNQTTDVYQAEETEEIVGNDSGDASSKPKRRQYNIKDLTNKGLNKAQLNDIRKCIEEYNERGAGKNLHTGVGTIPTMDLTDPSWGGKGRGDARLQFHPDGSLTAVNHKGKSL
ncbi:hypothetical protein PCC7424_1727 [Gloeothece citriformis PCC 7424]|uniref:eCIS core domain-containing protein n=1 Tax=Gloeothece citriformis (strain PCC 7424) TaxID=65393 RepID=B7KB52_GLOC7|nr:DUF4157 domain-containing protein [Gloeothece citriformis]ACK70162.1 hypothetical protein PCC7424_1727 [Gloeothece citriformis PCC 7424]